MSAQREIPGQVEHPGIDMCETFSSQLTSISQEPSGAAFLKDIITLQLVWMIYASDRNYNLVKGMLHHKGKSTNKQGQAVLHEPVRRRKAEEIV